MTIPASNLDDLLAFLRSHDDTEKALDWTSLPAFGGEAPRNAREVWSWDETRLLVGTGTDLRIVPREAA